MKCFRRHWVLIALALTTFFFPLLACPHRIDEAHFQLIQHGMSEAEVEAIFGAAAGSYDWAVADGSGWPWGYTPRLTQKAAPILGIESEWNGWIAVSIELRTWTSRHGTANIWFRQGLVGSSGTWGKSRVEPPWQRWWNERVAK
jgi:hypothetical protein